MRSRNRIARGALVVVLWPLVLYVPFSVFLVGVYALHWFGEGDYSVLRVPMLSLGALAVISCSFVGMRLVRRFLEWRYDWVLPLAVNLVWLVGGSILAVQASKSPGLPTVEAACMSVGILPAMLRLGRGERVDGETATT